MKAKILGYLDDWAHRLHLPRRVQRHLCDAFDRSLGWPGETKVSGGNVKTTIRWKP